MAVSLTYLPGKIAGILNYATQVHDLISGEGFTINFDFHTQLDGHRLLGYHITA